MYCSDCGGYKIETVGDCYVASFGIIDTAASATSKSVGAINAIEMALRIVEVSVRILRKICGDSTISMRVGVRMESRSKSDVISLGEMKAFEPTQLGNCPPTITEEASDKRKFQSEHADIGSSNMDKVN